MSCILFLARFVRRELLLARELLAGWSGSIHASIPVWLALFAGPNQSQAVQVVLGDLVAPIGILISPPFQVGLHVFSELRPKIGSLQVWIGGEHRKPRVGLSLLFLLLGGTFVLGRSWRLQRRLLWIVGRRKGGSSCVVAALTEIVVGIGRLQSRQMLEGTTRTCPQQ